MATPDPTEIRFAASRIAEEALESAALRRPELTRYAQDWFPGYDPIDRRLIVRMLAEELLRTVGMLQTRLRRLEHEGNARCPKP